MKLEYKIKYKYETIIGDLNIKYKGWTTKNEKDYLKLIENEKVKTTDKEIFEILILPVIENKKLVISSAQQKKLLIDIRKVSISEYIEEEKRKCEFCKKENKIKVKFDDITTYKKANYKTVSIKDDEEDNFIFSFSELKTMKDKQNLNISNGLVDYIYNDFLLHITEIQINDDIYNEFSKKELISFIDSLPSKVFDFVFESYQEMIDETDIKFKNICKFCKKEEEIDYNIFIPNFLWA